MTDGRKLHVDQLWVLMVTAFVDMVGFALILPLLPYYTTRFGGTGFTVGGLVAAFAFAQMIAAPLWGRLSDRFGRRPIILTAQLLSACAFLVFAFADSLWLLLVCRFLQGAGGGTTSVISAYVSDVARPEERAKGLGWITACTSAGVMIGPAIASFSVRFGYEVPGLIAASLAGLNILFAWRWLPESAPRPSGRRRRHLGEEMASVVRHPTEITSSLIWVYAAGMMAFMAMNAVLALFLADRFGITEETIGGFYFAVGLVSVVMRAAVLGWAVRRFGEVRVLRLGAAVLGAGMLLAPATGAAWQFLLAVLLIPIGTALLFPSTTSLISRYADPEQVGQTLGVQQTFGGISRLLGPMWAGAVFDQVGKSEPFWIAGALVLSVALLSLRLKPGEAPRPRPASAGVPAAPGVASKPDAIP